ncbi:hypothetical protein [uncultured Mobiluncus sp.]|uniref:hypothetical protein n=1 Tax=uncultured Mobiluncus sp. TaxID=293425 RepID=UPI0025F643CD|nr:hypothetical protein [uncultured Mobiluncus sp.]
MFSAAVIDRGPLGWLSANFTGRTGTLAAVQEATTEDRLTLDSYIYQPDNTGMKRKLTGDRPA